MPVISILLSAQELLLLSLHPQGASIYDTLDYSAAAPGQMADTGIPTNAYYTADDHLPYNPAHAPVAPAYEPAIDADKTLVNEPLEAEAPLYSTRSDGFTQTAPAPEQPEEIPASVSAPAPPPPYYVQEPEEIPPESGRTDGFAQTGDDFPAHPQGLTVEDVTDFDEPASKSTYSVEEPDDYLDNNINITLNVQMIMKSN